MIDILLITLKDSRRHVNAGKNDLKKKNLVEELITILFSRTAMTAKKFWVVHILKNMWPVGFV